MVNINYIKSKLIILTLIATSVFSCRITSNQKKVYELEIDVKLRELLEEDLKVYVKDYFVNHDDTLFVGVVDKNGSNVDYIRFYQVENIKDDFEYLGYFTCNSFVFLIRDYENKDDTMDLFKIKDEYKFFPEISFELKDSKMPIDKYQIFYKYVDGVLSRE